MKDNKIDIMTYKIGEIIALMHRQSDNTTNPDGMQVMMDDIEKALRVLQTDLHLLRKCTIDNPDFKFSDDKSQGYTEAKVEAFKNES